jgi:hypothetical protein
MDVPSDLNSIIRAQHGLVTRKQALARGLSAPTVRHALGPTGGWQKVVPGVYATFTGPLGDEHRLRAALLRAGTEATLTGARACQRYGMTYVPAGAAIEILVPRNANRTANPLAKVVRVTAMPRTRTVRGVRVAVPERAALDMARSTGNLQSVRAVLCEVVQRRLATAERVAAELDPS